MVRRRGKLSQSVQGRKEREKEKGKEDSFSVPPRRRPEGGERKEAGELGSTIAKEKNKKRGERNADEYSHILFLAYSSNKGKREKKRKKEKKEVKRNNNTEEEEK